MTVKFLDGKKVSQTIHKQLKIFIQNHFIAKQKCPPGLAVILVGNNEPSHIYIQHKQIACQNVGIYYKLYKLSENVTEAQLIQKIEMLNNDNNIHGIIIQLPLPRHINSTYMINHIDPQKDVDGFHPINMGRLALRQNSLRPCTSKGVMTLLKSYEIDVRGLHAVVIGISNIVGRPMLLELLLAGATVTSCHSYTNNLPELTRQADLLISATGQPLLVKGNWIKPGAIVVDIGISLNKNRQIVGDVHAIQAKKIASWLTPVPGGVGPMTVTSLLQNTLTARLVRDKLDIA